jgi:hypothetical protein
MTLKHVLFAALVVMSITAYAEKQKSEAVYAGQGRWVCSGNTAACAQVDANNRQQQERTDNEYKRSQDAASAYVDRERRKEEERKSESRRY